MADATVFEADPDSNAGSDTELSVNGGESGRRRTFVRFPLGDGLPGGATIDRALLRVFVRAAAPSPFGVEIRSVTKPWNEAGITWSSQPMSGALYGTSSTALTGGVVSFDVTDLVTHWASGQLAEPSIALSSLAASAAVFTSREGATDQEPAPRLVLTCHVAEPLPAADPSTLDGPQGIALARLREKSLEPPVVRLVRGAVAAARFRVVVPAVARESAVTRSRWFLREYAGLLRTPDTDATWQLNRRSKDGLHLVFRQRQSGVPVVPAELIVHLDGEDVIGLSGSYSPDLGLLPPPRLTVDRAQALARELAGDGSVRIGDAQLAIVDTRLTGRVPGGPRLAWWVPVAGAISGGFAIDALTGETLSIEPAAEDAFDLTLNTAQFTDPPTLCWHWSSSDVEWFDEHGQTRFTAPLPDAEGFSAFSIIGDVYEYWKSALGRDAFNGGGGQIGIYLDSIMRDLNNNPSNNAAYRDYCNDLIFSDNMGTRDVIAHEFTHGVVRNEAGLRYQNQSGALNESYADLFGHFVDSTNWTIGEGSAGGEFRDMRNPPRHGDPDHMNASISGDGCGYRDPNGTLVGKCVLLDPDNGFVHTNSGIMNKAAYLITQGGAHGGYVIGGLGAVKAQRLFYDVLSNRLTGGSQFIDMRDQMVAEANASPRLTRWERCDVRNAYAAVGVGTGDANCDGQPDGSGPDDDGDTFPNTSDNCPTAVNYSQSDLDGDGAGDACDADLDGDGVPNLTDNCPRVVNARVGNNPQPDFDHDGTGDACDDSDGDGVVDRDDNCRLVSNADQANHDTSAYGDACDDDDDDDGINDVFDLCPLLSSSNQDQDRDGIGDECDNCPTVYGNDVIDTDRDGLGDLCDPDRDNDGIPNEQDNCPAVPNRAQTDWDGDGAGDACDMPFMRQMYEDPTFFALERYALWPLLEDVPLEIGVPLCPRCGGTELGPGFAPVVSIKMDAPFTAILRDGTGRALDVTATPGIEQFLRFEPAPFAFSRFEYVGLGARAPSPPASPGIPAYVNPDQLRYFIELYPAPGTDRGVLHGVRVDYTQCEDADGDGYGTAGSIGCPGGDAIDCDDTDWSRAPGRAEACDGLDNDCNGLVDDQPVRPAGTARVFVSPAPDRTSRTWWTELSDTATYDVARGVLGELLSSGRYDTGGTSCIAQATTSTEITDTQRPKRGDGFWYLVRGKNCAGDGTYDETGPGQPGSRDPGLPACDGR